MKKLSWDTNFFGNEIYRIDLQQIAPIESVISDLPKDGIAYVFCPMNVDLGSEYLVDIKTILSMSLLDSNSRNVGLVPSGVSFQELKTLTSGQLEDLYSLSIQSSIDSRFRKNSLFEKSKVDQMYRLWIDKAVASESHFIYGHVFQGNVVSLCVVKLVGEVAWIELFAVDEFYRGRGFGFELLSFVANKVGGSGIKSIKVTTQLDNKGAMGLYQKFGFQIEEQTRIFHIKK